MKYYWAYYQIIIVIYNNILVPQICKKKKTLGISLDDVLNKTEN